MCASSWITPPREQRASLLGARTLLGAKGIPTRSKDATRSKGHPKLLLGDQSDRFGKLCNLSGTGSNRSSLGEFVHLTLD